jgi:hypothetical protein
MLAVACFDLKLRNLFKRLERQICHRTSPWRRGFARQRLGHRAAAYWACRGISRTLGLEAPKEVEDALAMYCNNPLKTTVRLYHRALSSINNIGFHWHRRIYQDFSGPQDAVRVALRILEDSGVEVLRTAACVRGGLDAAVSDGQDISERVCCDAELLMLTLRTLRDARGCIEAHPTRFGAGSLEAIAQDARLKEERRQREELEARMQAMGVMVSEDPRM